jgi:hypothetical protein
VENEGMQTLEEPLLVDPAQTHIMVRVFPHRLSRDCLTLLKILSEPKGRDSDCLREWLSACVDEENARRLMYANDLGEPLEPPAWLLPWHSWKDNELAGALSASYSWLCVTAIDEAVPVIDEIHRAVVTACGTRLREFADAIEAAQRAEVNR